MSLKQQAPLDIHGKKLVVWGSFRSILGGIGIILQCNKSEDTAQNLKSLKLHISLHEHNEVTYSCADLLLNEKTKLFITQTKKQ